MDVSHVGTSLKVATAFLVAQFICLPAGAQVSKEVLDSISTPNQVETSIGTLEFLDGHRCPRPPTESTTTSTRCAVWTLFSKGCPVPPCRA